jgi:methyl-accepting chemotaxis protein
LSGDASYRSKVQSEQNEIDDALKQLEVVDAKYNGLFETGNNVAVIKARWIDLKNRVLLMGGPDSADAHTRIINNDIFPLIFQISNKSNLVLDPELDSYYAMDLVVNQVPDLSEILGQARAYGLNAIARKSAGSDQRLLSTLVVRGREGISNLNKRLQIVLQVNASLEPQIRPAMIDEVATTNQFLDIVERRIINSSTIDIPSAEYLDAADKSVDATFRMFDVTAPALDALLAARIQRNNQQRLFSLGLAALSLIAALVLVFAVARSITQPISQLSRVADRLSLGELDARIEIDSQDEVGELAESISRMQVSLQAAIERLRSRRTNA